MEEEEDGYITRKLTQLLLYIHTSLRCMAKIITSTVGPPCHCAIPLINASNSSSQDCIY
jgi:hypothetical protein